MSVEKAPRAPRTPRDPLSFRITDMRRVMPPKARVSSKGLLLQARFFSLLGRSFLLDSQKVKVASRGPNAGLKPIDLQETLVTKRYLSPWSKGIQLAAPRPTTNVHHARVMLTAQKANSAKKWRKAREQRKREKAAAEKAAARAEKSTKAVVHKSRRYVTGDDIFADE